MLIRRLFPVLLAMANLPACQGDSDGEFTVILGEHGGVSYEDGPTVHLVWEGIFLHEFGHALGLSHHYCDDTLQPCAATPPGEFEAKCIMSRNAATWGPAEQFVL